MACRDDVYVRYDDLLVRVGAFTIKSPDGLSYTVLLNPKHSYSAQQMHLKHELEHIEAGDFDRDDLTADQIETERHKEN